MLAFCFFSSLPKQPSCVFWSPVNHSSSSGRRGEEYMTQARKNAGRSGALAEEARNKPWAGAAPSKLSPGSRGAGTAGTWAGTARGQLGDGSGTGHGGSSTQRPSPAQRGAVSPLASSRSGCFQDLKNIHVRSAEGKRAEKTGALRGWQEPGSPGVPKSPACQWGDWCQPRSVAGSLQGAVWGQAVGWGGFLLNLGAYTPACHGTGPG